MIDINLAELKVKLEYESVINIALNDLKKKLNRYFSTLEEYVKASTGGYNILISDEKFPFNELVNISGVKISRKIYYFTDIYVSIDLDERNIFGFRKKLKMKYCCSSEYWTVYSSKNDAKLHDIDRAINSVVKSIDELQLKIREVRNNALRKFIYFEGG